MHGNAHPHTTCAHIEHKHTEIEKMIFTYNKCKGVIKILFVCDHEKLHI